MYPDHDTLSNVPRSGYIMARDQSMVESEVTEGGKNKLPAFFFMNEHNTNKLKSNDFQRYPRRETAASGGKRGR